MQQGAVIWLCGLAGAGKTTFAQDLFLFLKKQRDNIVLLDGDVFRSIFQEQPDFSKEGRLRVAKKISALCSFLSANGMIVVCATISLFEEIYMMNRQNIPHYLEVFIKCEMEELKKRDKKGLYSAALRGEISNVMGVDIAFTEPEAHLVIDNSCLENLIKNQKKLQERVNIFLSSLTKIDDRMYWEKYYTMHHKIGESSLFAKTCMKEYFKKGQTLVELGCGNGRDSVYFAHNGIQVLGIDQCQNIIDFLQQHTNANLNFQCADFTNLPAKAQYDIIYSRFTLHSITQRQQDKVILWAKESLKRDGIFAIEVRGYKNSLYKMGIPVEGEKDAFIFENHYRRFLSLEDLLQQLQDFNIIYAEEKKGFAPFKEEDDYFIRVIAKI